MKKGYVVTPARQTRLKRQRQQSGLGDRYTLRLFLRSGAEKWCKKVSALQSLQAPGTRFCRHGNPPLHVPVAHLSPVKSSLETLWKE